MLTVSVCLQGVSADSVSEYLDGLRRATNGHPLTAEDVQRVISQVNQLSSQQRRGQSPVSVWHRR